jgi:hypothetical protein
MDTVTLQVPEQNRTIDVTTDGDALVINTTTTQTVDKTASKADLSRLHRATLEAYATNLELGLDSSAYETRGDLIDAILAAREGVDNG